MGERDRLRVLQSFPGRGARTNPYLLQLVDAVEDRADILYFSWRRALLGRWDVLHVHWPERLLRGSSPARSRARAVLFRVLLLRLTLGLGVVVRTKHNLAAHDGYAAREQKLLGRLDRRTALWIRLNPFTDVPEGAPVRLIPHGDYRSWYPASAERRVPGRLLFVGLVRPYKGVEELLRAFVSLDRDDVSLRVAGDAPDDALRASVLALAEKDSRVSADLRYVDDATMADEIASAQIVVLPYRAVHNSGAALLALSLGRPVLMPANDATRWLRDEVGASWVVVYEGNLSPETLADAMDRTAAQPSGSPEFEGRTWGEIGDRHIEAYMAAVGRVGRVKGR